MSENVHKTTGRAGGAVVIEMPSHAGALHSGRGPAVQERPVRPRLVYLLSRYPAVSHTFFLNEVQQLRKQGFTIDVASINPPDRPRSAMPAVEAEEAANTFYIKSTGLVRALLVTLKSLLLHPVCFLRGLAAARRLGGWHLKAQVFAFFYFIEGLLLGDWMRRRGHNRLHIHFGGPVASVGMLTSITWGIPYSITIHGPDEFHDVDAFYLAEKIRRASFVLCISEFCRSQLMRIVEPAHWDKMHVVRLGVDPERFVPGPKLQVHDGVAEIVCVGRLVPAKGQLILLQACQELFDQGYELRLRLVGDGPDRKHLEEWAAKSELEVIFEGAKSHPEVHKLLQRADIFALASFAEGVPVALMEAMAMGVPCVSTSIAGIPELIRDGRDGILVPASSVEALAAALRRLLDDAQERAEFGAAGRERVMARYNLQQNALLLGTALRQQLHSQER